MPAPFQDLDPTADPPDFVRLLARFPFERKLTAIHVHHTSRLRRDEWRGHETLRTVWFSHTQQLGWSDIAQHLTIAPDGWLWSGRDWNRPPCSSAGCNGDRRAGPFMVVLAGDFNAGNDALGGEQLRQLVEVVARLHDRFSLGDETLRFHRELEPGGACSCPGATIDRGALVEAVRARRAALATERAAQAANGPTSVAKTGTPPFGDDAEAWYQFITICNQNRRHLKDEPPDVPRAVAETQRILSEHGTDASGAA